jgi:LacI family transcriptional regulator
MANGEGIQPQVNGFAPRSRPTLDDIARIAGVSKRTASRVLNRAVHVRSSTRARVERVIALHGYAPDPQGRGLARGRSNQVALVYDNPNPQHILTLQLGLLEGLADTGLTLIVHPCRRGSADLLGELEAFVLRQKLFGVVLPPPLSEDEQIAELLRRLDCPYVRLASAALDAADRMVVGHDRQGALAAGRRITALGHRRVGFISGPANFRSSGERREGLIQALAEAGLALDPRLDAQGGYTYESGLACGRALLALPVAIRPTAIFAANDEMATGVLRAAHEAGVGVPNDVTVIGFDDFAIASRVFPALTTVHTPTHEAALLAALKLQGATPAEESGTLTPRLVVRASCGPAPCSHVGDGPRTVGWAP